MTPRFPLPRAAMGMVALILAVFPLVAVPALAQDRPVAPLERLGFLAGSWTAEGESADAGRFVEEYDVAWRHGGAFLQLEYAWKAADGRVLRTDTTVIGWDPMQRKMVSFQYASDGSIARGVEVDSGKPDTWTWEGKAEGPARAELFRITLLRIDDGQFALRVEIRKGERDPWQTWSSQRFRRAARSAEVGSSRPLPDPRAGSDLEEPLPDGPGRMVRIDLERFAVEAADSTAFDLAVRYRDDRLTAGAGDLGGSNGLVVIGAGAQLAAGLRTHRARGVAHETTSQFLVLMEGGEASFEATESTPVVRDVVIPVYRGAVVVRTIQDQVTGSGFRVRVRRATAQGIDVELTPYFHRARRGEALFVTELSTRLTLAPGRPYAILAERAAGSTMASALLSYRQDDRMMQSVLVLTARVEGN